MRETDQGSFGFLPINRAPARSAEVRAPRLRAPRALALLERAEEQQYLTQGERDRALAHRLENLWTAELSDLRDIDPEAAAEITHFWQAEPHSTWDEVSAEVA